MFIQAKLVFATLQYNGNKVPVRRQLSWLHNTNIEFSSRATRDYFVLTLSLVQSFVARCLVTKKLKMWRTSPIREAGWLAGNG